MSGNLTRVLGEQTVLKSRVVREIGEWLDQASERGPTPAKV